MTGSLAFDLVVLVADLDQQEAVRSLLGARTQSMGIRAIRTEFLKHPRHDPGCFHEGPDVLQPLQERAAHAIVLLDREGSGQEALSADQIEVQLGARLATSGWGDRARAVVIDPELEVWVWSDSSKVDEGLGWAGRTPTLREWLRTRGLLLPEATKPHAPKEAFEVALREVHLRRSASLFSRLAEGVGLERCKDPSFSRFRSCLKDWFG